MSDRSIAQIILIVFFTIFWSFLSWLTNSNSGIYAGLASIFVSLMFKNKER